jgi:hypothetical protein
MKRDFEEILDICLERITVKGDSIEQCLESYPEHASELEPVLRTALSFKEASSAIKPRPEFERVTKYRLLSEIGAGKTKRAERVALLWGWQRRWALAIAVLLVLILVGGSTVTASASSLPGDILYPVKTATEKVQGFFTFGSDAKASFHMKLAQRRLNELELLAERNRAIPQSLLDAMDIETDRAIGILDMNKPIKEELVTKLISLTFEQNIVLEEVIEQAPSQAKFKLQEALRKAEQAHNRATLLKRGRPETEKPKPESTVPSLGNGVPDNSIGNESSGPYRNKAGGSGLWYYGLPADDGNGIGNYGDKDAEGAIP